MTEVLFIWWLTNYSHMMKKNGYEFIGILPERRKDPKRITKESVLNWGRMILGNNTDGKKIFFKSITIDDITGKTFEANLPFYD
ncbi:MAG: hypothetical protein ACXU9L_06405 [Thermodesulfobacteriota bacterium]